MWTNEVIMMIVRGIGETVYMTVISTLAWICIWASDRRFAGGDR